MIVIDNSQYPDFLGIGAQKAATTWLDSILRIHPDVWLPPVKELHYWSDADWVRNPSILDRLRGTHPSDVRWRRYFFPCFKRSLRYADIDLIKWNMRFFFGEPSDQWYQDLFPPMSNKQIIRGEITPEYALIGEQELERIRGLNSKLKIIYFLRDPIDRAWSQARMNFKIQQKMRIQYASIDQIRKYFKRRDVIERGLYSKTLRKWQRYFDSENIFVESVDNISNNPEDVVAKLFEFLNISNLATEQLFLLLTKKVFQGEKNKIPKDIERYLASCYLHDLQELTKSGRVDCTAWLNRAKLANY